MSDNPLQKLAGEQFAEKAARAAKVEEKRKELHDFLFNQGLYSSLEIGGVVKGTRKFPEMTELIKSEIRRDIFCSECNDRSTFSRVIRYASCDGYDLSREEILFTEFTCGRVDEHRIHFMFHYERGIVTKVGQYPSAADIQNPEFNKYKKLLGNEKFLELKRGVGLFSHGVGIGSFVYLRRIVEYLVEDAHNLAKEDPGWDEEDYKVRFADKVTLLKDHLPPLLVKNTRWYSIVSSGVHELTDEVCLEHFPVILKALELILDEKLRDAERAEQEAAIAAQLGSIQV